MSVPENLAKEIDELIDKGYRGYRTPTEFVIEAVRRRLDELEDELKREGRIKEAAEGKK